MTDAEPRATEESNANDELPSAERLKAFTDAVVAIAMTLLILPLMDSVTDADETSTAAWLAQEWPSLLTFMLSFVLIANFWLTHHRMFARVERVDHRDLVRRIEDAGDAGDRECQEKARHQIGRAHV